MKCIDQLSHHVGKSSRPSVKTVFSGDTRGREENKNTSQNIKIFLALTVAPLARASLAGYFSFSFSHITQKKKGATDASPHLLLTSKKHRLIPTRFANYQLTHLRFVPQA